MRERLTSESEPETLDIARSLGKTLRPGMVVTLTGDLGAGKTVFTRGIAESLGVDNRVTSPTFTLINEYSGDLNLYHMDLYRLDSIREIEDIGVEDYMYGDGVCVIEWAEKLQGLAPSDAVNVSIRHNGTSSREIVIERSEP